MERRTTNRIEIRAGANGHIFGHAALFNEEYVMWDSDELRVSEVIRPGTFTEVLKQNPDVRCLFNHDPNQLLGRTASGTLALEQDSKGLKFDCETAQTQIARDVRTSIQRRDITGNSFAFTVSKQKRTEDQKGNKVFILREIQEIDNLFDVGPVTYPAYEATDVSARAIDLRSIFPEGVPERIQRKLRCKPHASRHHAAYVPPAFVPDVDDLERERISLQVRLMQM